MNTEILEELGLTKNESLIYLALLELGSAQVSKIASKTNLNRANMYNTINSLIKRGLISYVIKNNIKHFTAAKPIRLLEILKEKQGKLQTILPELESIEKIPEKIKVEIYEGKEGAKAFFSDMAKTTSEVVAFGVTGIAYDILEYYAPKVLKQMSKKIKAKYICIEEARGKEITTLPNTEFRYLPKEYSNYTTTIIYRDKIAILILKDKPRVVMIEDQTIAEGYRKYFKLLWKIAKP